jgi:hypothetical protein
MEDFQYGRLSLLDLPRPGDDGHALFTEAAHKLWASSVDRFMSRIQE